MAMPDGDKRWTAILSIDMVGFTRLSSQIGAERMYDLLSHVLGLARTAIETHGGHVIDTAGDGILAAFGAPQALENAPLQVCRAAISFRDKMGEDASTLTSKFGVTAEFRTGISGGVAMIAHQSDGAIKVVGGPVNAAARLQALAEPNAILMTNDIRREVEGAVRTSALGPIEIKGFDTPLNVHRLDGLIEAALKFDSVKRRGIVDLVSRQDELRSARAAIDASEIAVISGPPGIGKSRLMHEVTSTLSEARPTYIGQCAPTGLTPAYGPVLDILRQAGQVPIGSDRRTVLAGLFDRHPDLNDPEATERFLAPEKSERDQTRRALDDRAFLIGLLRGLADRVSAVFVIEDVHWIDTATNGLLAAISQNPVPMMVTCRPEFRAEWLDLPTTRQINLSPLSEPDIQQLVEANLKASLSEPLAAMIAAKAEGNPLMAEEITRALQQNDRLQEGPAGLELAAGEGSLLTGNLEQLVLARVDRLAAEQKSVLQIAATIGRDFPEDLLTDALGRTADLDSIAQTPGLIELTATGQWRFAHALIRDAVYGSLLSAQREAAHLNIARAIENSGVQYANNWPMLAEHYLKTSTPEKSTPALVRAAVQSLAVYALYDVDHRLEQAMGFLETDPDLIDDDTYSDLVVSWLRALDQIGDFGRVLRVAVRVLPRLERRGYTPALGIARTLISIAMTHARDYRGAEEQALKTLSDAEAEQDELGAAWAKLALMRTYEETGWQGLDTLERLAAEIAPVAEKAGDHHLAMSGLYLLSSSHRSQGSQNTALAVADEIIAYSTRQNDRRARTYGLWARALVYVVQGSPEKAYALVKPARNEVVAGSGDDRVFSGLILFSETFMHLAEKVRPSLLQLIAEARSLQDYNIAHSAEWVRVVLELRAGNLALGWRLLNDLTLETEQKGHKPILRQNYLTRAEIRLSMIGLIDPASEAPPERPKPTKKRPGLADLITYASLRIGARAKAEQDLLSAMSLSRGTQGGHIARCQVGLGLIALSRGRKDEARKHLTDCLKTIEGEDFQIIENRARAALDRLA